MFAKLLESPKYGQILVKIDTDNEERAPEVRFYVQPANLGVCSFAIGFSDSDKGWDLAEKAFEKADLEQAEQGVAAMFDGFPIDVEFEEEKDDAR